MDFLGIVYNVNSLDVLNERGLFMKRYVLFIAMTALLVISVAAGSAFLSSGSRGEDHHPMQEITAYTSLPAEAAMALSEAYEKEYNIRVNFVQLSSEQILKRLHEQSHGEQDTVSALVLADRETLDRAAAAGYLIPYISEKSDQVADAFRQSGGYWTGVWYDPVVFAVNQDYLRTHLDLPNSWQMLAQQSDIRIGITDFMAADASSNLLYSMIAEYGDQRAFEIWRRVQPKIMQYSKYLHTPVRQAGMGEVDLAIAILSETLRYVHDDYPIRVLYPVDGTSAVIYGTGLAFKAEEREIHEAANFADWLLTDEAQIALTQHGFYFLATNPMTLSYQMFAGKNISVFKNRPYFSREEKQILLDRWIKEVRFYEE